MVTLSTQMVSPPSKNDIEAFTQGKSTRAAQCITTTILKAQTLLAEGYSVTPTTKSLVYEVQKPPQLMKRTGDLREFAPYIVDAVAGTCTCQMFGSQGVCKHERAVRQAVRDAMALLVPAPPTTTLPPTTTREGSNLRQDCPACQGQGERLKWAICSECEGRAEVQVAVGEDRYGYPIWEWQWCSTCDGRGGQEGAQRCAHCEGTGVVEHFDPIPSQAEAMKGGRYAH